MWQMDAASLVIDHAHKFKTHECVGWLQQQWESVSLDEGWYSPRRQYKNSKDSAGRCLDDGLLEMLVCRFFIASCLTALVIVKSIAKSYLSLKIDLQGGLCHKFAQAHGKKECLQKQENVCRVFIVCNNLLLFCIFWHINMRKVISKNTLHFQKILICCTLKVCWKFVTEHLMRNIFAIKMRIE